MQLGGKKHGKCPHRTLADLTHGEECVLDCMDLPDDVCTRLMELGFVPGTTIAAGYAAPGGDPRVFRVDGSEIALRRETASFVRIKPV